MDYICLSCGELLPTNEPCPQCKNRPVLQSEPPLPADDFSNSQATRLLSAACYLGTFFRISLYENFVRNRYKALAPDFGIHLPTVIRHCCHARRRAFYRTLAFCTVLAALTYQYLFGEPTLIQFGVALAAVLVINFVYKWTTFSLICKHFTGETLDSSFAPPLSSKLAHLDTPAGNLVVYSGFSPFVGAGTNLGAWSFVTDTKRGKRLADGPPEIPLEFRSPELYQVVSQALRRLALPGLSIEDRVYVSGHDARHDTRFFDPLLQRPRSSVEPEFVRQLMSGHGPQSARLYRCIRVVDWKGELVVSFFLRLGMTPQNLFVEASSSVLTPIDDMYRLLEKTYTHHTFLQFLIRVITSTLTMVPYLLWAPFNLAVRILRPVLDFFRHLVEDWLVSERASYDFGAVRSARELGSQFASYRRFSIQRDAEMLQKTLEKCVLDAIVDFLDQHRIDTSGIRERETAILNSGVIISGGNIKAESLAIGKGAMSRVRRMVGKAKAASAAA